MRLVRPRPAAPAPDLLPALNVVLLLLGFFVMLAQLQPAAPATPALPPAQAALPLEMDALALAIDRSGALRLAGGEPVAAAALAQALAPGHGRVRLAAERSAPAAEVLRRLAELQAAGARHVQLQVSTP